MEYIIIGASAAGLACAAEIRNTDPKGTITILTKEGYEPYSRPSISYYLKGKVTENDMLLKKSAFYKANNIKIETNAEVTAIDKKAKTVKAGKKSYKYDKLCLCTGSVPFTVPVDNIKNKTNVFTFLDLESTKKIKQFADENKKAVVIGAGLIGMKAAEGLSKICKSVDVVELSDRILPSILDDDASKMAKKHLEAHGIKFHLGTTVKSVNKDTAKIKSVTLQDGTVIPCDMLIQAVGVRPATALAEKAELEVNRGIITNPETMQTSDADIYAAGDCCVSVDMLDGNKKIIALWPNAVLQGKVAGSQMAGGELTVGGTYSVNAIDFYGLRICTCGLINAKGEEYKNIIIKDESKYKKLCVRDNKLVGFVLINNSDNAGIYTDLIAKSVDLTTLQGDIKDTPSIFLFDKETRINKLRGGATL